MATLEQLLSQGMVERLGWTLIHFVWQATAIALLLAVVLRFLSNRSAGLRYIVSCLALALIVALPMVTMQLVEVSGPVAEAGPVTAPAPIAEVPPVEVIEVAELSVEPIEAPVLEVADATIRVPWRQRVASALEPALPWLVLGWLLGVFGLSAWHLGGWAQLQRMRRRMVREVAAPVQTKLGELAERLGVRQAVELLESALVDVPTVVGWIKPVILLPASALTGLEAEQLEAILAHELAHIRRYDYLVNIAQSVVEILGFYHPAVWWVSRQIRDERENCCDDLAVGVCGDSVRYARALTCLEEMRHHGTELAVAANGGSLVARIGRLLGRPTPAERRFAWLPGLIALLLVATIIIPTALVLASPELPVERPAATVATEKPQEARQVLLDFVIAKVASDATLDHETAVQARNLLADVVVNDDFTLPTVEELQKPLWQILKKYTNSLNLTAGGAKAFTDLLISRGYGEILSRPHIVTRDGRPASIIVGEDPNSDAPDSSDNAEGIGLRLDVTPTVQDDQDTIRLSLGFHIRSLAQLDNDGNVSMRMEGAKFDITSTFRNNKYAMYPLTVTTEPASERLDTRTSIVLLLVKPTIVKSAAQQEPLSVPSTHQSDNRPRQVLLDFRTVAIERSDLADLGVEWSAPQISAGAFGNAPASASGAASGSPWGVQIGYTADEAFTNSVQETLDRLCQQGRARLVARQRIVAIDGRLARVTATTEEQFSMPPAATTDQPERVSIATGTVISAMPRIADNNEIILELALEYSDSIPPAQGGKLPVVTRRTSRNVVTIKDGGTVVVAGVGTNNPDSEKDIAVFVTARLVPETGLEKGEGMIAARREYVNSDPVVENLLKRVVEIEQELIVARQTLGPKHPELTRTEALLGAMKKRLEERRREWEEGVYAGIARRLAQSREESESTPIDPMAQELAKKIAEVEVDLIAAQQNLVPKHPTIVEKEQLLAALNQRLEQRQKELEQSSHDPVVEKEESSESTPIRVLTEATDDSASSIDEKTRILLDFEILDTSGNRPLTREAANRLSRLWDRMYGKRKVARIGRASLPDIQELQVPPAQLFKRCAQNGQGDSDALEILSDLLQSGEYVQVVSKPRLEAINGKRAEVRIITEEHYEAPEPVGREASGETVTPPAIEMIEYGTVVSVTPHAESSGQVTLEMAVEVSDMIPADDDQRPRVSTHSIRTKATLDNDTTLVLRLTPETGEPEQDDVLYLLVRAQVLPVEPKANPVTATPATMQTDWSAAQEGVQIRLRADRHTWRTDEIPALRWDVQNVGAREFLHLATGQRRSQLEVDGVWYIWPPDSWAVRLAGLGMGQSLADQPVTLSPIWSKAKPEDLQWRDDGFAWGVDPTYRRASLQLAPGKHTIRLAVIVESSRVRTGGPIRAVSPPMDITIAPSESGPARSWPPGPELAQAFKETMFSAMSVLTRPGRPEQAEMSEWVARALSRTAETAALAKGTPLDASVTQMAEALAALRKAVDEDVAGAAKEFAAVAQAYNNMVGVFSGQPHATAQHPKEVKEAVQIEARFLHVSDEFLKGLVEDPNTPEELVTALTLGEGERIREAALLDDTQVIFLLRATQGTRYACSLAAPMVTVLDGESAEMRVGRAVPQFVGFSEPDGPSGEPVAQYESIHAGVEFNATPHLQKGSDNVYLEVKAKITSVLGNEERMHKGRYPYTFPIISTVEVQTSVTTPLDKIVLIDGGQIESLGQEIPRPGRLVVLTQAQRKTLDESETPPVGPPVGLPMGGMGGLAPGQPPLPPMEKK